MKIYEVLQERFSVTFDPPETKANNQDIAWDKLEIALWLYLKEKKQFANPAMDAIVALGAMGDPRRLPVPATIHGVPRQYSNFDIKTFNKVAGIDLEVPYDPDTGEEEKNTLAYYDRSTNDEAIIKFNTRRFDKEFGKIVNQSHEKFEEYRSKGFYLLHELRHRGFSIAWEYHILGKVSREVEHAMIYAVQFSDRYLHMDPKKLSDETRDMWEEWREKTFLGKEPEYWEQEYFRQEQKVFNWMKQYDIPNDVPDNLKSIIERMFKRKIAIKAIDSDGTALA